MAPGGIIFFLHFGPTFHARPSKVDRQVCQNLRRSVSSHCRQKTMIARNFDDLVIQSRNKSCSFAEKREITAKHLCQIRKQSTAEVDILSLKLRPSKTISKLFYNFSQTNKMINSDYNCQFRYRKNLQNLMIN